MATTKEIVLVNKEKFGDIKNLKTEKKDNMVNAVNEVRTILRNIYAYSERPTTADIDFSGIMNGMTMILATSSMKTNKPNSDGEIINLGWDNPSTPWNTTGSQLFVPHDEDSGGMQYRGCQGASGDSASTWWEWRTLLDSSNYKAYCATANHTHSYAGSSSVGGAATSANKINTDAGSATNPVYFSNGIPKACSYSLNKTVPSDAAFTDTKNTAGSTDTSSKIFLIGATSQAANPQTYSHDTAYVGTDGCLYSGGTKVSVNGHTHSYAGSSSAGGAATSANKLATARTIRTNLGSTSTASFDGSANITPGVTGTLPVANGGTGATTLTSGAALIGNGTSAVATRSITNMTSVSYITYNTNLMTTNTLAYWNGAYNSDGTSNLAYCKHGAIGNAATKSYTDSSSASAIGTGTSVPTERDIYYGLPTINGSHSYTSGTNIYAPTSAGTSGYVLKSAGSGAPSWVAQSTLSVGSATSATSATKATQDGSGNTITSTYAKKSIYGDTYISYGRVSGSTVGGSSIAYGYNCTASANYGVAMGHTVNVTGSNSIGQGGEIGVHSNYAAAFGYKCYVYKDCSMAIGSTNHLYTYGSFVSGQGNTIGSNSDDYYYGFAAGKSNSILADYCVAFGSNNNIYGDYSNAFGYSHTISGSSSHCTAFGYDHTFNDSSYSASFGNLNDSLNAVRTFMFGCSLEGLTGQLVTGYKNNTSTAKAAPEGGGTGNGSSFVIGNGTPSKASNAFRVTASGYVYATNAGIYSGADYAEYFEWSDGNEKDEDRVGYFVTFDDDDPEKIKIANEGDYILGIVSAVPSVVGNGDECWTKRYVTDKFGRRQEEEITFETKIPKKRKVRDKVYDSYEENNESGFETKIVKATFWKENPDYNNEEEYITRENRKEWNAVGLMGVLTVYDDGTCKVNGYCKCHKNGIATSVKIDENYHCNPFNRVFRVIKRVDKNIIKVVLI